jgi:hypothetical protein
VLTTSNTDITDAVKIACDWGLTVWFSSCKVDEAGDVGAAKSEDKLAAAAAAAQKGSKEAEKSEAMLPDTL